jgi:type IV fimbrial biogenesis protein FimT
MQYFFQQWGRDAYLLSMFEVSVVQRGFTLLELMASIAILAIVVGVAVPSFMTVIENNRSQMAAEAFYSALIAARSEAVKRNQPIVLCKSADELTCINTNDWEQGWIIFADENANNALDVDEPLVQTNGLLRGATLRASFGANDLLTYLPDGTLAAIETFNICIDGDITRGYNIDLNVTGRPSKAKGAIGCP